MSTKRIVAAALIVFTFAAAGSLAFYYWRAWALGHGECDDAPFQTVTSPNGRVVAASVIRNCGATTSYTTVVRLRATVSKEAPGRCEAVVVSEGKQQVALSWLGDDSLEVTMAHSERVLMPRKTCLGVTIRLRPRQPPK